MELQENKICSNIINGISKKINEVLNIRVQSVAQLISSNRKHETSFHQAESERAKLAESQIQDKRRQIHEAQLEEEKARVTKEAKES